MRARTGTHTSTANAHAKKPKGLKGCEGEKRDGEVEGEQRVWRKKRDGEGWRERERERGSDILTRREMKERVETDDERAGGR